MTRVGLAVLALALCACGGESAPTADEEAPPPPEEKWSEARIEGLASPSGVALHRGHLLFTSADTSRLYSIPREGLRDGARLRPAEIALDVEGERETFLKDDAGPRSFRLKQLWPGPQNLSGLALSSKGVLYVASEAYRVIWFGPLEVGPDDAPERCVFQRAVEVPGASRTRRSEADWQDYGDPQARNGISGVAYEKDDLIVIERGRGVAQPLAYRLDDYSGHTLELIGMRYTGGVDEPATRWWSDVGSHREGFLAAFVREPGGVESAAPATALVMHFPRARGDRAREGRPASPWVTPPAAPRGETYEGFAHAGGDVFAVRRAGASDAVLVWRAAP